MKSTGIIRKVDELGRIVLPIELRRTLLRNVMSWRFLWRMTESSCKSLNLHVCSAGLPGH